MRPFGEAQNKAMRAYAQSGQSCSSIPSWWHPNADATERVPSLASTTENKEEKQNYKPNEIFQ